MIDNVYEIVSVFYTYTDMLPPSSTVSQTHTFTFAVMSPSGVDVTDFFRDIYQTLMYYSVHRDRSRLCFVTSPCESCP